MADALITFFLRMLPAPIFFFFFFFLHLVVGILSSDLDLVVNWENGQSTFQAGDIASIKIEVVNTSSSYYYLHERNLSSVSFELSVNGTDGNGSYVSGVVSSFDSNSTSWSIKFIPLMAGVFSTNVSASEIGFHNSSLQFTVSAGLIYYSACSISWNNMADEFVAGSKAVVLVHPVDAFGNDLVLSTGEAKTYNFSVSASFRSGQTATVQSIVPLGLDDAGNVLIQFTVITAGNLLLYFQIENQQLYGSPIPFIVYPGLIDITKCYALWNYGINNLQVFSKLEIFINQNDMYGNMSPEKHSFDADVVTKATNLSLPLADMAFHEVQPGVQLLTFTVSEPGEFLITIFNNEKKKAIPNMPLDYTVSVGYCHGSNSVLNGTGLSSSIAGQISAFSVYLQDNYDDPSPINPEMLRIDIIRNNDSYAVNPNVSVILPVNGSIFAYQQFPSIVLEREPLLSSFVNDKTESSSFNITYVAKKSGRYEIWAYCGNIPLNLGRPFALEVSPAEVDVTASSVVNMIPVVQVGVQNQVLVQLLDRFMNPVSFQKAKLRFANDPEANVTLVPGHFEELQNGSYFGYYEAKEARKYNICILFEESKLTPCPFEVRAEKSDYFPHARNVTVAVWEDESVAFDIFTAETSGSMMLLETSKPSYGSLLAYDKLFRYTPFKGFVGNDSFCYTISDVNHNTAVGNVNISVLSSPRFQSLPVHLLALEDVLSPIFGGFTGFELRYSNVLGNITLHLSVQYGTIFFSASPLQNWHPLEYTSSEFAAFLGRGMMPKSEVALVGSVEVINSALQSIQYLGNKDFNGQDVLTISLENMNGKRHARVPIIVEPVNDPPYIRLPQYAILENREYKDGLRIFDPSMDKFEFCIGDPDSQYFPEENRFLLASTFEVSSGVLIANLHASLFDTAEFKMEGDNRWQKLESSVIIKEHFLVKASTIRFRGGIKESNEAMQQMLYQGRASGALLTVSVNDMGNFGCYPENCTIKRSVVLSTRASMDLIKKNSMKPLLTRSLGLALVLGFIATLILGSIILYFICKCALSLQTKLKRNFAISEVEAPLAEHLDDSEMSDSASDSITDFTGCSGPFMIRRYYATSPERSCSSSTSAGLGREEENVTDSKHSSEMNEQTSPVGHTSSPSTLVRSVSVKI